MMDINDALDLGDVVPLKELLSWGPSLWEDEEEEEFVPNANEVEENEVDKRHVVKEEKPKKRLVEEREELEEADEDLYAQLLVQNELFGDDVEDDSYDFLADIDGNVELLKKDREDELEVGAADRDDLDFLNADGGASFVMMAKAKQPKKRKKDKDPQSSPAKGTRAATASFRFKHPVLTMNVPESQVQLLGETEPTEEQLAKIQDQLNVLQQFLLEGLGLAHLTKNTDLVALYQSILLEMEVQYTLTGFSLNMLAAASGMSKLSDISGAIKALPGYRQELAPSGVVSTPARAQKGSNAFFGPAIDEIILWGLKRM